MSRNFQPTSQMHVDYGSRRNGGSGFTTAGTPRRGKPRRFRRVNVVSRVKRAARIVCTAAAIGLAWGHTASADLTADQTPFHTYRGIWVDRFDYSVANAASSIRTLMTNSAALGITDVMFQVRGQADAYYW